MTRINVIPTHELTRSHLVAEYREITRLPGNLNASLNRQNKPFNMSEIPPEYVLGKGHVKFFYPRMKWLKQRFEELVAEMLKRGYNPNFRDSSIFENCPSEFFNDYQPTQEAQALNRQRIADRLEGVR